MLAGMLSQLNNTQQLNLSRYICISGFSQDLQAALRVVSEQATTTHMISFDGYQKMEGT